MSNSLKTLFLQLKLFCLGKYWAASQSLLVFMQLLFRTEEEVMNLEYSWILSLCIVNSLLNC